MVLMVEGGGRTASCIQLGSSSMGRRGKGGDGRRSPHSQLPMRPCRPPCPCLQSFGGVQAVGGDQLLVPANILDHWYQRLSNRLRRDPDFLTRRRDAV